MTNIKVTRVRVISTLGVSETIIMPIDAPVCFNSKEELEDFKRLWFNDFKDVFFTYDSKD